MFCEDNKLVMVGLNSVESSIFSFNSEVAMNRDMESLIMEIKEYKWIFLNGTLYLGPQA